VTETELIQKDQQIRADIARKKADLRSNTIQRRAASAEADAVVAKPFLEALAKARTNLDKRVQAATVARSNQQQLRQRRAGGDDTVTVEDLNLAETAIEHAELPLAAAKRELKNADRAAEPFRADNHLAHLAADVIEPLVDAPVLIHKRPQDAPDISPAIILSQVTPTAGYGTIKTSGEVGVTVVGEPELDLRAIGVALADAGCDATASRDQIVFNEAAWPIPRLSEPSGRATEQFASVVTNAWAAHIETNDMAAHLASYGYKVPQRAYDSGATALSAIRGVTFEHADGRAVGTVRVALGAIGGHDADGVKAEVEALIDMFADSIGNITEAGEITAVTLVGVGRGDGSMWDRPVKYGISGHALYPATVEAEVRVEYVYEPVTAVIVND
jgi:hypothetical protein